jgi:hypothetical protein
MSAWSGKRADWQEAVTRPLALKAPEADGFVELDRSKKEAIVSADRLCARGNGHYGRETLAYHSAPLEGG